MHIEQLTQKNAETIADTWKYPGIYAFYNMTADPEDYEEIVTAQMRRDYYYQVIDDGKLHGSYGGDGVQCDVAKSVGG